MLLRYRAAVPADGLVTQPFFLGEHCQQIAHNARVERLCVGALLCAVSGECVHLGFVRFLSGASDVVIDKLLSRRHQRRWPLSSAFFALSKRACRRNS